MARAPVTEEKHEPARIATRAVLLSVAALIGVVLLVAAVAWMLTHARGSLRQGPTETSAPETRQLTSAPVADRRTYDEQKTRELNGYGWMDGEHRFARVPVARAMQLLQHDPDKSEHAP